MKLSSSGVLYPTKLPNLGDGTWSQSRIHIAVDFKIHAQEIAKPFHVCLLFVGRILIPTSILHAAIGRVLTN